MPSIHQHADRGPRHDAATKTCQRDRTRSSCSVTPTVIAAAIDAGPQLIGQVSG